MDDYFKLNPDKRPAWPSRSTNLWRGYVGTWRIADQKLWLVTIQTGHGFELVPYPLGKVFKLTGPCVSADWYSGKIPYRKEVVKTEMRKMDETSNGQIEVKFLKIESLVIEKGIVVKTVTEFDNP